MCELSARTWGPKEWWVLVQKDEVAGPSGVGGQGRVAVVAPVTSAAAVRAASLERLL